MPEDNSVKTGSQPGVKEEDVKQETVSSAVLDANADSSTDKPWNKDPRFREDNEAYKLGKSIKSLMEANNLEDTDELVSLIESGQKVRGKQVDLDNIDDMRQKAKKLEQYEAYWKAEEERRKREQEDPDQTIARLDAELKKKAAQEHTKEKQEKEAEAAKEALRSYEKEVHSLIKDQNIPKDQTAFILEFFGVGSVANEIDITDKRAIKKMIADGIKKKEAYDQSIIQAYIKGKEGIPKVSAAQSAPMGERPRINNLKEAHKFALESFQLGVKT